MIGRGKLNDAERERDEDWKHERELDGYCTPFSSGCTETREHAVVYPLRCDTNSPWRVRVMVVLVNLLGHVLHRLGIVAGGDIRFILTIDELQNTISCNHQFW